MSLAVDWLLTRRGADPMDHIDDVFRYAMARINNREDAEDIAIEIVQALPNPCNRRDLRIYMVGMARRKIADHFRRKKHAEPITSYEPSGRFDLAADNLAVVANVLESLSDDHREVLVLKYVVGMTSAEIGEILEKRSDAVDSLLQRARACFANEWLTVTCEEVNW